ncbi:golgin subfamily B member 1-like isoform X2 [Leptotrombidium deliense]|uniref:Golgin subfamily B member 1-like isoform X2 n=1 Tax=Leptotrombidium deliense TaxID=299467 RepID=A0A443SN47_9ACAR|nr:golgin subfamily B member 1-like isoform X2 [Leptotrombidium deliense]
MSQSVDSLQALLRSNEEKLKVKEKQLDDLQKKFNVAKLKLQSLQKQVVPKESKDADGSHETIHSVNRGKVLLLQKQLAESRALLESKELENKQMKDSIDKLSERAKVVEESSDYLKSSKSESLCSNLTRSSESEYELIEERKVHELTDEEKDNQNLFAQIVLKDTRILELNQRCLDLEKRIIDLQENLKEKDEVLQARNKAVKMLMSQSAQSGFVSPVSSEDIATIENQMKQINTLQQKLAEIELEKGNLQLRVMELEGNNGTRPPLIDIELERDDLRNQNDELRHKFNEVLGKFETLEIENERLTMAKNTVSSEMNEIKNNCHLLENKVSKLKSQIDEKDKTVAECLKREQQLLKSMQLVEHDMEEKIDEINSLKVQMSDLAIKTKTSLLEKDSLINNLRIELDFKEENLLLEKDEIINELNNQLQSLSAEKESISTHLDDERKASNELKTIIAAKESEVNATRDECSDLKERLSKSLESISQYEAQLTQKDEQIALLSSTSPNTDQMVKEQNDIVGMYEKQLAELKLNNDSLLSIRKKLEQRLQDVLKQRDESNTKAADLEEDKQELCERLEEMELQYKDMYNEMQKLNESKKNFDFSLQDLKNEKDLEINEKNRKIEALQEQLKNQVRDMSEIEELIAEKDVIISELSAKVSSSELNAATSDETDAASKANEHIRSLENQLQNSYQSIQNLEKDVQEKDNFISTLSAEKLSLIEKVSELREELEAFSTREEDSNHEYEKQIKDLKDTRTCLQRELDRLSEELSNNKTILENELKSKEDVIGLKLSLQNLNEENSRLNETIESLKTMKEQELSTLRLKLADFSQNWDAFDGEHQKKVKALSDRVDQLQFTNESLLQEKHTLTEEMENLRKENEEKVNTLQLKLNDFSGNWDSFDSSHKKEVASLSARIEELCSFVAKLEEEKKILFEEKEAVKKEKEKQVDILKLKLADFENYWQQREGNREQKVLQLSQSIDELRMMNASLENEKHTLFEEIGKEKEEKEKELSSLRLKLADLSSHSDTLENDLRNRVHLLNQRVNELENDNSVLQQNLFEVTETCVRMEEEKNALLSELREKDNLRMKLEEAVSVKKVEHLQQSNNAKESDAKVTALEEKLSNCQLEMFNVLSDKDDEILMLKQQMENVVKQLEMERIEAKKVALLYEESRKSIAEIELQNNAILESEVKIRELEEKVENGETVLLQSKEKDKMIENLKNEIKICEKKLEAKCKELENCVENYEQKMREKEQLKSERSINESSIVEQSNQRIAQLEQRLNESMNIIADNQSTIHSLRNEASALINQLEFERSQTRETVSVYEQQLQAIAAQQHNNVELESKCKRLSARLKVKDREFTVLQNKMTLFKEEILKEKEEELNACHKKIAELESIAKSQEEKLNEECSKRRAYEEEMESFWRVSKISSSTNLMIEDIESTDGSSSRGASSVLSAIQRLSLRVTRNWLQTGPPSRKFKRYVFILYLLLIHILVIKSFLF